MVSGLRCAAVLAIVLCTPSLAQAQTGASIALAWHAPPECPSEATLRARLSGLNGTEALSVIGRVLRQPDAYVLQLAIATAAQRGERTLRAQSCEALVQSLVWLAELARTPNTDAQTPIATNKTRSKQTKKPNPRDLPPTPPEQHHLAPSPTSEPGSATLATAETQPTVPPRPLQRSEVPLGATETSAPAQSVASGESSRDRIESSEPGAKPLPSSSEPLVLAAGVGVGAAAFGFGSLAPAFSVHAQLSNALFSGELQLTAALHPDQQLAPGASVAVRTWSLGLHVCKEWGTRAVLSFPCGVGLGMRSSASSEGLHDARARSSFWAALGAGARAHLWLDAHWRVSLDVSLLVPVSTRPSFEVADAAAQAGQLLGYAQLNAGLRIP